MDTKIEAAPKAALSIPRWEFIFLIASLMAMNALAIDIMLPGLQEIGASLGVTNENHRQFVISAYFAGMAVTLLAYGPASDRFGRRAPLLFGLTIYLVAAFAAVLAPNFESLLALRFLQGCGAAALRVISISIVRDRFSGRQMAEVMSLAFMVFMVVPVFAPGIGQLVMMVADWHYIFICMGCIGLVVTFWAWLRLPETQHPEDRRPFKLTTVGRAFALVLTTRVSIWHMLASAIMFGALFGFINSAQQVLVGTYGVGKWFPIFFAGIGALMAISNFANSKLVLRLGMHRLSQGALFGYIILSAVLLVWSMAGTVPLPAFVTIFAMIMFQSGWIGSNFNAIAMEPLGHVAGAASSVAGFIQTLGGGLIGAAIGQAYDGTTVPLMAGYCAVGVCSLVLILIAERGRLFRSQHGAKPVQSATD